MSIFQNFLQSVTNIGKYFSHVVTTTSIKHYKIEKLCKYCGCGTNLDRIEAHKMGAVPDLKFIFIFRPPQFDVCTRIAKISKI